MSEDVLEVVADNLARWQSLVRPQRRSMAAPPGTAEYLEDRGLLDSVRDASAERERELVRLKSLYGDAVRRVPGAVDEDLVILHGLGLLLNDSRASLQPAEPNTTSDVSTESGEHLVHRGRRNLDMQRFDAAIDDFHAAIRSRQLNQATEALTLSFLGEAHDRRGDLEEAVAWYERAISAGLPGDTAAGTMMSLGLALERRGRLDEAIRWYTDARALGFGDNDVLEGMSLFRLGAAFSQLGNTREAIRWHTSAVESGLLDSDDELSAMASLGLWSNELGDEDGAIHWFTRAAERGHARAMAMLGLTLRQRAMDRAARGQIAGTDAIASQSWDWLRKAAAAGEPTAQGLVEDADRQRRELESATGGSTASSRSKEGCYIATAVYGSYDAPPVVTLRRYRDERLLASATGRAFVRSYYAVSPRLAKSLGRARHVNRVSKSVLDVLVGILESRGYGHGTD